MTVPVVAPDHWKAEYSGNRQLSGAPAAVVDEGTGFVEHSWGTGGPAGLADHLSARFTRTVTLAAGRYRFSATTDDGSRLWIDDQLQIDAWGVDGLTTHTVDLDLAAGDHTLRFQSVEYTGGATAQLTWALRTPVVLASGESLGENQTRVSLDGAYRLQYQGDGNLVVVRLADDSCAWSSQTNNTSVGATVMQGDGNLVIYNGDWTGIWSTGTWGHDGARLEIANDELAVVAPDETKLWWVSLAAEPAAPNAWAGATMGTLPGASSGPAGRAAGFLLGVIALVGFVASVGRRRWFAVEPRAGHHRSGFGGQAPSCVRGRFSATALLLAAMLVVPASALAQTPTQVVEYYHTDALGSVRAVTKQVNGQWQVVARHDFMPFGEEVAPQTPPPDKRLFTGKERDSETGLDYFEARYLGASRARFTTVDPVGVTPERLLDPQQLNRYAYVTNNPLRFIDPSGEAIELLGDLDDANDELASLKRALGGKAADKALAARLYVNSVLIGGKTRYFVGVRGDLSDFMRQSQAASNLGNLVAAQSIVQFGLTNADLRAWGGARTMEPGQDGNGGHVRVLMNPSQLAIGDTNIRGSLFARLVHFEGQTEKRAWTIQPLDADITIWHEFGHAWGAIRGGSIRRGETDAEALIWENQMRELWYGPLGPNNAPRRKHGK